MKQTLLKIIALFIVVAMAFAMFAACAKKTEDDDDTNGSDKEDPSEDNKLEEDYFASLPKDDYNEYEFKVLTLKNNGRWDSVDFAAVEPYGETINDAVFDRNAMVEDKYNIKIVVRETPEDSAIPYIRNSVNTQDNAYDMVMPRMAHAGTLAQEGLLLNLNEVPGLDLEKSCWDQASVSDLSIGGKLYMVTGDLMTLHHESTNLVIFNKNLIQSEGLEDPYQLVRENKWTFDKLIEMITGVTKDLNGDDKLTIDDQWGLMVEHEAATSLYTAMGERLITKDNDDIPRIAMDTGKTELVIEKVVSLMSDSKQVITAGTGALSDWTNAIAMFAAGKVLFRTTSLRPVRDLREMEMKDDYGILPLPKYDENQERYYHNVQATGRNSNCVAIPSTADAARTGKIIQALCAASTKTLRVAYYDINLLNKNVRDTDSWEMLDIIFSSRLYDLGTLYDWGGINGLVKGLVTNTTQQFASRMEQIRGSIETSMNRTIDNILAINH